MQYLIGHLVSLNIDKLVPDEFPLFGKWVQFWEIRYPDAAIKLWLVTVQMQSPRAKIERIGSKKK